MISRQKLAAYIASPLQLAIFSGVLTVILSALLLRGGIKITPDGWTYWEGSVSLLNGEGYVRFGGQPIMALAPLFSIYLAGIQKIVGVSGGALVLGLILLAALTSSAWTALVCTLSNREATSPYQLLLFPIYVSMFVSFYYRHLLSESLFLALLALLFLLIAQIALDRRLVNCHSDEGGISHPQTDSSFVGMTTARNDDQGRQKMPLITYLFCLNIILALLLLCRHSALVFLPGVIILLFLTLDDMNRVSRVFLSLLTALFPLASWSGLRQLLEQSGSHPLQWGGHYTPLEYVAQIVDGLATLLGPQTFALGWGVLFLLGFAILCLLYIMYRDFDGRSRQISPQQIALRDILAITLSAFGGLYGLFNLTYVHDLLSERFLWFLVLAVIGVLAAYTTWLQPSRRKIFFGAILLLVTTLQTARTVGTLKLAIEQGFPLSDVAPHATIRADYVTGVPLREGNFILVAPPSYDWIDREYSEKAKSRGEKSK